MRLLSAWLVVAIGSLFLAPAVARGQVADTASLAGVVRDASGGVLPGVTVEAASPALIEKVRTVVTDGQGIYRIVDLRPGIYTVTFTLPGFTSFRREGLALTTGFTAAVNAELKVGALERRSPSPANRRLSTFRTYGSRRRSSALRSTRCRRPAASRHTRRSFPVQPTAAPSGRASAA